MEEKREVKAEEKPKAEIKVEEKVEEKTTPPSPPPPEKVDRTKGDRAFELGNTYRKMGLKSESDRELRKALEIYNAFVAGGGDEDSVSDRISSIEDSLSEEAKPAKRETPAKPATKAEKKPEKKAEEKKETKGKKKRISYV